MRGPVISWAEVGRDNLHVERAVKVDVLDLVGVRVVGGILRADGGHDIQAKPREGRVDLRRLTACDVPELFPRLHGADVVRAVAVTSDAHAERGVCPASVQDLVQRPEAVVAEVDEVEIEHHHELTLGPGQHQLQHLLSHPGEQPGALVAIVLIRAAHFVRVALAGVVLHATDAAVEALKLVQDSTR